MPNIPRTTETHGRLQLDTRERRFVEEFCVTQNGSEAARRAGVPPKGAGVWASHRLRLPRIKAAIAAKLDELSRQTNVNAERVILELARVGFSDLRRVFREDGTLKDPRDWDDDTAAAIKSIKVRREKDGDAEIVEINTWDKCAALDKLGRHLRLFDGEDTEKLKEAARRLTDLSEEELVQRILAKRADMARDVSAPRVLEGR